MRAEAAKTAGARRAFDPTCFLDALTAALLSGGGICLVLFLLGQGESLPVCLLLSGAQALLLLLLSRRWWAAPALLLALLAAAGIFALRLGAEEARALAEAVFSWIRAGMPAEERFLVLRLPLLGLATLPLTLLFYALARRFLPLAIPALYALLLSVGGYLADLPDAEGAMLAALFALMLCLPRGMASGGPEGLPRRYGQALALPLAAACLAGAFFCVPKEDGAWRSETVRAAFADVEDFYGYYFGGTAGASARGRSELTPLGGRLGGDLDLSEEIVLRVRSDNPFPRLIASIEDTYNGHAWYKGWRNGRFRYDSLLWRGRRSAVYLRQLPLGGREAQALYDDMTRESRMEIVVRRSDYSLFFAGTPTALSLGKNARVLPYFNLSGELFTDSWYPRGFTYAVTGREFCRDRAGFAENMAELLRLTAGTEDPYEEAIRARYTYLPEELPQAVRDLAREITSGSANEYEAMCRVEAWLRENCTYSETPGDPPEDADFVAHFLLETREGYCTYYASAMAVLARCCGLPSRYITGYGLSRDGESTDYTIARGTSAHAWAEVYFHGVGWVPFDPLDWTVGADEDEPEIEYLGPAVTPTPTPAPVAPLSTPSPLPETEAAQGGGDARIARAAGQVLGAAAALLLLLLLLRALEQRKTWQFDLQRLERKLGRAGAVRALGADLEKQLALYNLTRGPGETLRRFALRVDRSLPLEGAPACAEAAAVCEKLLYAGRTPSQEETRLLWAYHDALESALRKALRRSYLWRRALR